MENFSYRTLLDKGWYLMQETLLQIEQSAKLMRPSADIIAQLYRIYLLDREACITAAEFFPAADEAEAAEIAASLHAACSDAFSGYEVWHGTKRVAVGRNTQVLGEARSLVEEDDLDATVQKHQEVIIDLEDRLQRAFACVSRSRRLVHLAAQLRERRAVI